MSKDEQLLQLLNTYVDNQDSLIQIKEVLQLIKKRYKSKFLLEKLDLYDFVLEASILLAKINSEPESILACLLFRVEEDEKYFEESFSKPIAHMISALKKIDNVKQLTNYEIDNENYRKIFVALAKDYKVIVIRLVIQQVLMQKLDVFDEEQQINISHESLDVFAPLAHRLGMFRLKSYLENKALFYLDNEMYLYIEKSLKQREEERIKTIEEMQKELTKLLNEHNIPFKSIKGRPKQIYSIYKKMKKRNLTFDQLFDLLALRIITESDVNCYEILGYIHTVYKPISGKFKDYIAVPKPNMYQSLHTSVIATDNNIYEIQIRTQEMDDVAERGVAAHWRYKEGGKANAQKQIDEQLHWFRDYVSSGELKTDSETDVETLKQDIFESDIYVMSPRGRVIDLPKGSTPVDFAYRIHSNVGHSCVGALVNGVIVPLNKELKTGDVVVIKTSKLHNRPSESWLQFVKTNNAKSHIKRALKKKDQEEFKEQIIIRGKELISEEVKNKKIDAKAVFSVLEDINFLKKFGVNKTEDLFMNVANRTVSANNVVDKVSTRLGLNKAPSFEFKQKTYKASKEGIVVEGIDNIKVTLANCCNPIPGDEIIGYVSRGKGVRVHRTDCNNILTDNSRLINVNWDPNILENVYHKVDLIIRSNDRKDLLIDVINSLSQQKINIITLNAFNQAATLTTSLQLTVMVKNNIQLEKLINTLKNIKGVYEAVRATKS